MISKLHNIKWKPSFKWATLDVSSLYSNIPHIEGCKSVEKYLNNDPYVPSKQKKFILDRIMFILKNYIFTFQNDIFIQTTGTAMGTKCAPCFANLYVGDFEKHFIQNNHPWKKNIISYFCSFGKAQNLILKPSTIILILINGV